MLVLLGMFCKFPHKAIQSRAFVCWEFFDYCLSLVSLGVICLFRLFDSSWFIFERLYVSGNLPISSALSSLLAYMLFIIFSYCPLCFFGVGCYFSSLNSHFIYLDSLFSLMILVKGLSILFIFSKNQLLGSLIFCIIF